MRARAVVRRLRRAGLEDLIVTGDKGGYGLDPSVTLSLDPASDFDPTPGGDALPRDHA